LEDTINKRWIEQGDQANFTEFSQIVPEVAQRSTLARAASYFIEAHTLPSPYFPYVITPDMAEESQLLREIYTKQKAIVIGRNGRNFTVSVDTDIGEIKDKKARFDALIHYALAQGKQLDHDTLNSYDGRWSSNGLKNAFNVAVSQATYKDVFTQYIAALKEQNTAEEALNQAARHWLKEQTSTWLDWQSIDSDDEVLPYWIQQIIEDKAIALPENVADEDWIWVAGNTEKWMHTIKRYARLYGDEAAKWNGRKLAWNIQFKAWKRLLRINPHAANELHAI